MSTSDYDSYVESQLGKSEDSGGLLPVFAKLEGSGDDSVSPKGAIGKYQIMPDTAKQYGFDPAKLKDPDYNAKVATAVLEGLSKRYSGDHDAMMVGYNAGPGAADSWLANGRDDSKLPKETQDYLKRGRPLFAPSVYDGYVQGQLAPAQAPGTPAAAVAQAPATAAGATAPGVPQLEGLPRVASELGQDAVSGFAGLANMPRFLVQATAKDVLSPLLGRDPKQVVPNMEAKLGPSWPELAQQAGLTGRPETAPQSTGERVANEFASGAIPAMAMAPLTGGGSVGELLYGGVKAALSGGAGATAGSEVSRAGGGDLASLAAGLVAGGGMAKATDLAGLPLAKPGDTQAAFDRTGVSPPTVTSLTAPGSSPVASAAQWLAQRLPFGSGPIGHAVIAASGKLRTAVDAAASKLSPAQSWEDAGEVATREAQTWRDGMGAKVSAGFAPVDAAIKPSSWVDLDNLRQQLGSDLDSVGRLKNASAVFQSPKAQQFVAGLRKDLPPGGPLTWAEAQALRSKIGEARGVPDIVQDIGDKQLSGWYRALSDDMRGTAARKGVSDEWDAANANATSTYDFARDVVGPILNGKTQAGGVKSLMSQSNITGETLDRLKGELPDTLNAMAAAKLREALAKPDEGGKSQVPSALVAMLQGKGLSSGARDTLFGRDPEVSADTAALGKVASKLAPLQSTVGAHPGGLAAGMMLETPSILYELMHGGVGGTAALAAPLLAGPALASVARGRPLGLPLIKLADKQPLPGNNLMGMLLGGNQVRP